MGRWKRKISESEKKEDKKLFRQKIIEGTGFTIGIVIVSSVVAVIVLILTYFGIQADIFGVR